MTSRHLLRRVETLESRLPANRRAPKRCMPEWLQESFEADGWVFDARGQIISDRFDTEHRTHVDSHRGG